MRPRRLSPARPGVFAPIVVFTLAVAVSVAGCSPSGSPSSGTGENPGGRAVRFPSADGVQLEGREFGSGDVAVVLSHMYPSDQRAWFDFAGRLADEGYVALTYNFRGYCPGGSGGCSQGEKDIGALPQDVLGAIAFLRQQGASRVFLIGASMGGTASLVAASTDNIDTAGVATLSAPPSFQGLEVGPYQLERIFSPKLYVAGAADPAGAADAAQGFYNESIQPKRVQILPAADHGTDLLTGSQSGIVRDLLTTWLAQYRGGVQSP